LRLTLMLANQLFMHALQKNFAHLIIFRSRGVVVLDAR